MSVLQRFLTILLLLCFAPSALATHIRAGQITAVLDPADPTGRTYIFTLTIYRDTQGVVQDSATLFFVPVGANGVRGNQIGRINSDKNQPSRIVGPQIEELTYTYRFTFPGPGQYVIYFQEENRNEEIVNMSNSVNTPFYVETALTVNPTLGVNSTPVLLNPPVDNAETGQRFCHNPAAFDPDGDSLGFRLVVPRQNVNTTVNGYRSPETVGPPPGTPEAGPGAPSFAVNPLTGEICWDAPGPFGVGSRGFAEYNIAFVVEEWRRTSAGFVRIGQVVRDMQITVREQPNRRPRLAVPADTCVVAGTVLEAVIRAEDPDRNQQVRISSESAVFSSSPAVFPAQPPATLDPPNHPPRLPAQYVFQGNPAAGRFAWATACAHVRAQPYDAVFKAEDSAPPPNQLTDTRTWRITVVGPAPANLRAVAEGRAVRLDWDRYGCPNASEVTVWRRTGCSPDNLGPCARPPLPGYAVVGRVRASETTFLDTRVQPGVQYSYRVTAGFAAPGLGASLPSGAACARLRLAVPLVTKVSVEATGRTGGEIEVEWAQPPELDRAAFPGPYRYEVLRATGFGRTFAAAPVNVQEVAAPGEAGFYLRFRDRGLNTEDNPYAYAVLLYSGGTLVDSSRSASSVRLSATPLPGAVRLDWRADVPWDNTNRRHTVFRQDRATGRFEPLADVQVAGAGTFAFTDNDPPLTTDSVYCYRVQTSGSYDEPLIRTPLLNLSQTVCTTPLDTVRPCAVRLAVDGDDCELWASQVQEFKRTGVRPAFCSLAGFSNRLSWEYPAQEGGKACREADVAKYRVYYKRHEEDEAFALIDSVLAPPSPPGREYLHRGLSSYAGMYYVTAVDRSGNESAPSNIVAKDNCPYYELPNVVTPGDGDTLNAVFGPYPCPRFVQSGKVTVVNRWGRRVFQTSDVGVNWSGGIGTSNAEVSDSESVTAGVYYYSAELRTMRLRRRDEPLTIKGWVHILK